MAKAEEKREPTPESLKEKAMNLIHEQYALAAEAKSRGLTSSGSINPEFTRALTAQHLVEFASELGIFTEEEAEELKREYWDNRDKISREPIRLAPLAQGYKEKK